MAVNRLASSLRRSAIARPIISRVLRVAPWLRATPAPDGSNQRASMAARFVRGDGIEIGALHLPLPLSPTARVKYVDRMSTPDLRRQYADLATVPLVETDIIDNGETLQTLVDASQDFVVANHFIEHCQNPILTFQNFFRVLKPGGVVFAAVPDKRHTFDIDRPCTPWEHIVRDFEDGPEWSKRQHFEEWCRLVNKRPDETAVDEEARRLMAMDYSIHFHVWDASALVEFLSALHRYIPFELELFMRHGHENLIVLRKPAPPA